VIPVVYSLLDRGRGRLPAAEGAVAAGADAS
jgi:hypothetical protein